MAMSNDLGTPGFHAEAAEGAGSVVNVDSDSPVLTVPPLPKSWTPLDSEGESPSASVEASASGLCGLKPDGLHAAAVSGGYETFEHRVENMVLAQYE